MTLITVIPGDGIGPEVVPEATATLQALGLGRHAGAGDVEDIKQGHDYEPPCTAASMARICWLIIVMLAS